MSCLLTHGLMCFQLGAGMFVLSLELLPIIRIEVAASLTFAVSDPTTMRLTDHSIVTVHTASDT